MKAALLFLLLIPIVFVSGCATQESIENNTETQTARTDIQNTFQEISAGEVGECYIYSESREEWRPLGSLCSNNNECDDFRKTVENIALLRRLVGWDGTEARCGATEYNKLRLPYIGSYSCSIVEDCYSKTIFDQIPSDSETDSVKLLLSIKESLECNENFCSMPEGVTKVYNAMFFGSAELLPPGPENLTDECNIGKEFVRDSERSQYQCEEKSGCEWRPLGGFQEINFACCPEKLEASIEHTVVYGRCFILID